MINYLNYLHIHVDPFGCRALGRVRQVLGAPCRMRQREKFLPELVDSRLRGGFRDVLRKEPLHPTFVQVDVLQGLDEANQVGLVEGSVHESIQTPEIGCLVVHHKIIGGVAHQIHQPGPILNNHFPVSPGEDGCQKTSHFDVLLPVVAMRDRNRIGFDEMRAVVQGNLLLQKFS